MTFSQYQEESKKTSIYPQASGLVYTALGLAGEAGEVANKVKKIIRDKNGVLDDETKADIADELGDTLWYVSNLASELGVKLDNIVAQNLAKLFSRRDRGTLAGSGDKR